MTRQISAVAQIEGAENAGQLVGGCAGFFLFRIGEASCGKGAGGGLEDGDPFPDLGQKARPQLVEGRGENGFRGWIHGGRRSYFQPSTEAISVERVSGSKGLNSTASTPRSAKRR